MGMERENYYGFIEADKYELYEKVREYNRCFSKGKMEYAARLPLDEIEAGVDMTRPVNRQFIGIGHIFEQVVKGVISHEQANQQLFELLHLTMPEKDSSKKDLSCALSDRIYTIWNHIAINLRKDNKVENAIQIYEELMQCYKKK